MNEHQSIAILLQEVIDTMTEGGTFQEMDCCDVDSGLPFVYSKLKKALALAVSTSHQPDHPRPPSHRLQ